MWLTLPAMVFQIVIFSFLRLIMFLISFLYLASAFGTVSLMELTLLISWQHPLSFAIHTCGWFVFCLLSSMCIGIWHFSLLYFTNMLVASQHSWLYFFNVYQLSDTFFTVLCWHELWRWVEIGGLWFGQGYLVCHWIHFQMRWVKRTTFCLSVPQFFFLLFHRLSCCGIVCQMSFLAVVCTWPQLMFGHVGVSWWRRFQVCLFHGKDNWDQLLNIMRIIGTPDDSTAQSVSKHWWRPQFPNAPHLHAPETRRHSPKHLASLGIQEEKSCDWWLCTRSQLQKRSVHGCGMSVRGGCAQVVTGSTHDLLNQSA